MNILCFRYRTNWSDRRLFSDDFSLVIYPCWKGSLIAVDCSYSHHKRSLHIWTRAREHRVRQKAASWRCYMILRSVLVIVNMLSLIGKSKTFGICSTKSSIDNKVVVVGWEISQQTFPTVFTIARPFLIIVKRSNWNNILYRSYAVMGTLIRVANTVLSHGWNHQYLSNVFPR